MGFVYQHDLSGARNHKITNKAIAAGDVINLGAILTNVTGSVKVAVSTGTLTATAIYGLSAATSTSSDTFTSMPVLQINPGAVLRAQIEEIALGTTLTATNGSGTTCVDSSLVGPGSDDVLIGGKIEVVTMASGDSSVGDELTLTDYAVSTGTMTFSSVGSTGFANADTYKILTVGSTEATSCRIIGENLLDVNGEGDMIEFNVAAGGDWCRVVDVVDDGKQLLVAVNATYGNATVVTA
jgi:hypothetical protein